MADELQQTPVTKKRRTTLRHRRQQLAATERRKEVWRLAVKGASCRRIGETLGVSAMQVSRDIRKALEEEGRLTAKSIGEYRALEEARLDDLQVSLAKGVVSGDVAAVREARHIGESRRRLYGVDVPVTTKTEVTGPGGGPIESRSLVATLSTEELVERMRQAGEIVGQARQAALGPATDAPAVVTPTPSPEAAYEAVLKARQGNGNGGGNGHGA